MGTLLWDFIDVLTFGSLEKPPKKKHNHEQPAKHDEAAKPPQVAKNETKNSTQAEVHLSAVCKDKETSAPKKKK